MTPDLKEGTPEVVAISRVTKMWTNFSKYATPLSPETDILIDIDWKPVDTEQLHFVEIGEELTVGFNPEAERMKFWDDIYKDYTNKRQE